MRRSNARIVRCPCGRFELRPPALAVTAFFGTVVSAIVSACGGEPPVDPLTLSDNGIGNITKDTPFSPDVIADLYPDFIVESDIVADAVGTYPVINVIEGDQVLFTVVPDLAELTIFRVEVSSPFIALDNGATVGDDFGSLMAGHAVASAGDVAPPCARGVAELAPFVICGAPGYRHIHYVFGGEWNAVSGELPAPPLLARSTMTQLHWVP